MAKKVEKAAMSKEEIERQIFKTKMEIRDLEQKRMRSQAALMETLLNGADFDENDVKFFKTLTSMINLDRDKLQMLKEALKTAE